MKMKMTRCYEIYAVLPSWKLVSKTICQFLLGNIEYFNMNHFILRIFHKSLANINKCASKLKILKRTDRKSYVGIIDIDVSQHAEAFFLIWQHFFFSFFLGFLAWIWDFWARPSFRFRVFHCCSTILIFVSVIQFYVNNHAK